MKIGIFDSGVGGLTVLRELLKFKPNNEYYYVGDTLNMPYGSKSHEELFVCASRIIEYFIKIKVEMIIIACGTLSSTIYRDLKDKYKQVKILDIITPTIDYLKNSDYENIGVVATKNTIDSCIFNNSLKDKKVYSLALPKLASMIEHDEEYEKYLDDELVFFEDKNIELLVLGCTHYPIISNYFEKNHNIFNMALPIVEKIDEGLSSKLSIYFTNIDDNVINGVKKIIACSNIELLVL